MASKGKSEHERILDLENAFGRVTADLDAIARQLETLGSGASAAMGLGPVFAPILPVAPLLRPELSTLLAATVFALTPLPRTIAAGSGKCQCKFEAAKPDKNRRNVHNVTGNAAIACQVENFGDCGAVHIRVMRGAAEVASSPLVPPGNAGSLGPFAAEAGDTVEVVCDGNQTSASSCRFNWQINLA